jgi:hypothetical protein
MCNDFRSKVTGFLVSFTGFSVTFTGFFILLKHTRQETWWVSLVSFTGLPVSFTGFPVSFTVKVTGNPVKVTGNPVKVTGNPVKPYLIINDFRTKLTANLNDFRTKVTAHANNFRTKVTRAIITPASPQLISLEFRGGLTEGCLLSNDTRRILYHKSFARLCSVKVERNPSESRTKVTDLPVKPQWLSLRCQWLSFETRSTFERKSLISQWNPQWLSLGRFSDFRSKVVRLSFEITEKYPRKSLGPFSVMVVSPMKTVHSDGSIGSSGMANANRYFFGATGIDIDVESTCAACWAPSGSMVLW